MTDNCMIEICTIEGHFTYVWGTVHEDFLNAKDIQLGYEGVRTEIEVDIKPV